MHSSSEYIRVLHVDDEPDFSEMAAEFLKRQDDRFEVETATSASEALDRLAENTVDCVVSDFDMQGRNGIEFLEAVREDYQDLPFILYTGKGSEEVASEAISAGVTEYLQKESGTSQYEVLAKRIQNAVERQRAHEAAAETEQRLQTIAENTNDMLWKFTADWSELLFINSPYKEIWGRSIDELRNEPQSFLKGIHPDDRATVEDAMDQLSAGESVDIEYRVNADKDYGRWVWVQAEPVRNETGEVAKIVGFARDITERKHREQELAEQRADLRLFERAVEGSTDLIGAVDTEYNIIFANERHREFHGFKDDDIVGRQLAEVVGDQWESEVKPRVDRALAGEVVKFDMERTGADGEVHSFDLRYYPLPGENGTIVGGVGTMRDTTERKKQERKREQIIDRVTDAIVEVDADWRFTLVNEQAEELYDMSEKSLLGRDFWEVFGDAQETRFEEEYRHVMETREPASFTEYFSQLDGWFDIQVYPKDEGGLAFYFVEVTEQKEREQRYNAIFNQTYQFTGLLEPDGTLIEANETALEFGGLDRDEVIGKKMWNAYWFQQSEETRAQAKEAVERAADGELVRHELPVQGADGDVIIDFSVRPITNEQGEVTLLIPEGRDITDLKEREQELQNRTKQLQDIIDTVEGAIWIRNKDNEYLYMNQYHRDMFEIADDVEVAGKQSADLLPADMAEQFMDNDQRIYETEEPIEIEETVGTDDGLRDYLTRIVPLYENGSVYATCGIATDVTEQKARERRLDQFASIVSHDLQNPLSVANGRLKLAAEECDSEHLAAIERAHDRMADLIDDLLTLAREGEVIDETTSVDLESLVEGCWSNVETAGTTLVVDIERTVQADESRLEQVFENLIRNAIEHSGEDVTVTVGALAEGFYIEDDGPGIPPEAREDMFETGYSTAEDGTGFGLNIVKQIVDAHNWNLRVTEGADGGARFEITGVEFAAE